MRKRTAKTSRRIIRGMSSGLERPWTRPYDRRRDLPRLIPLFERDLAAATITAHAELVRLLRKALWQERRRARARHWTYDPARHAALVKAYGAEVLALQRRSASQQPCPKQ